MKILQINSCAYIRGGADSAFLNTIELLKRKNHEVSVFSTLHPNNKFFESQEYFVKNIDYRQYSVFNKILASKNFIYSIEAYQKLQRLIEIEKPEIAHIHLFLGTLTTSILKVIKKNKIPIVVTLHDFRLICPAYLLLDVKNNTCEKCKNKFYLNCTINRCSDKSISQSFMLTLDAYFRKYIINPFRYIDKFIFVSNFSKNKHIEFNQEYSKNSEVLYNFLPNFNSTDVKCASGDYFLYYGRLSREKGILTLMEAFKKNTNLELRIAGTGPLINYVNTKQFPNIKYLGFQTGNELENTIKNASFIIIPSECYENNPMTIIEAYSYGKPVIGADIGGISEIVRNNETGYLFESKNNVQMDYILDKASKITEVEYSYLSKKALEFANDNFTADIHYNSLMEIYQNTKINYK